MKEQNKIWIALIIVVCLFGFTSINNAININKCYEQIKQLEAKVKADNERINYLNNQSLTTYQKNWVSKQASSAYCSNHECNN